jgi:hypothetical protein
MKKSEKARLYTGNIIKVKKGSRVKNDRMMHLVLLGSIYQPPPVIYIDCTFYLKFCYMCGSYMTTYMINKLTCSDSCRHKFNRLQKKGINGIINKDNYEKPSQEDLIKFGFA